MTIAILEEIFKGIADNYLKKIEKEEDFQQMIAFTREMVNKVGCSIVKAMLEEIDDQIFCERDRNRYRDKGKCHTNIKTLMGCVEIDRHKYIDRAEECEKKTVYLLDDAIGMSNHETICEELGRELIYEVCEAPYRKVARRVQEITGMSLSHQQIWTYIQKSGEKNSDNLIKMQNLEKSGESRGEIQTQLLYYENDGIWLSLQGKSRIENKSSSKEMKVGIAYDGVRWSIGKNGNKRRILDEKVALASFDSVKDFESKKKAVIADHYDMSGVELIIKNGDGAGWIQKEEEIQTILVLDEFHRNKKLRECLEDAEEIKVIRDLLYANEIKAVLDTIESWISESEDSEKKDKLIELYNFFYENKVALASPYARGITIPETREPGIIHHARLGSMESNIYTVIGRRMKGNRCSWSVKGGNNLAYLLCLYHTDRLDEVFKSVQRPTYDEEIYDDKLPLSGSEALRPVGKGYEYPYSISIDPKETWLKEIAKPQWF